MLSVKHLIDTNSLTRDDIQQILDTAQSFEAVNNRDIKKVPHLSLPRSASLPTL